MHPYATDSNERKLVPGLIALLGVIAALMLGKLLEYTEFSIPWWFDSPAVVGFYTIFHYFFNKSLWKFKIFQKIGLVKVPNLNGTWDGYARSSFDNYTKKYDATFTIQQDWNKISILGEFEMSKSCSLTASIFVDDQDGITLSYEYINQPSSPATNTMEIHRGFTRLSLKAKGEKMFGQYYTGRGRQNIGELKLEKV